MNRGRRGSGEQTIRIHPNKSKEGLLACHSRLLSFVGAVIVFLTFVVKEGLADRWKEDAASVQLARYMYGQARGTSDVLDAIYRIAEHIEAADRAQGLSGSSAPDRLSAQVVNISKAQFDFITAMLDSSHRELESADLLIEKLPSPAADRARYESLQQRLVQVRDLMNGESNRPPSTTLPDAEKELVEAQNQLKLAMEGGGRDPEWLTVNREIDRFTGEILSKAEVVRVENEGRGNLAWWLSAVLYTLGWSLALVGRLFGVQVDSEA
jgi:hypothetical protein